MDNISLISNSYSPFLWPLWVIIATVVIQGLIASLCKAKQPGAIPGLPPKALSHQDFVFRAYRTHMNSLENFPLLLGSILLAVWSQVDVNTIAACLWVYAIARLLHMVLYYKIATDKNPSPRSHFFLIAWLAQLALLGFSFVALI